MELEEYVKEQLKNIKVSIEEKKNYLNDNIIGGLDLSKTCPGFVVLDKEKNKFIYKAKFKEKKNKDFFFRVLEIEEWLLKMIKMFKCKNIMLEAPFVSPRTFKSNIVLLKIHGCIIEKLLKEGVSIYTITPSASRAFLKSGKTKEETFCFVQEKFPELELKEFKKDNDIADAAIVALNCFNKNKKVVE